MARWTIQKQALFLRCLRDLGDDFEAISAQYLPEFTPGQLRARRYYLRITGVIGENRKRKEEGDVLSQIRQILMRKE